MPFKLQEEMTCMMVRDIIRYVLLEYWPGINWTPSGIFVDQNMDSPFNVLVKRAVEKFLDTFRRKIREMYTEYLQDRTFSVERHFDICRVIIENQNNCVDARIMFFGMCSPIIYYQIFGF
ncbi:hypothetical protein NPIL_460281 [Nephila pilipes]|uniref:Uncharacterized protein n=1 Tax=Nephila pilipes TaxID=299642 RepID=A0A8X6N332_NEPPI|nr:hypothetical protein NPIL_460281 [Nephila pilipes]